MYIYFDYNSIVRYRYTNAIKYNNIDISKRHTCVSVFYLFHPFNLSLFRCIFPLDDISYIPTSGAK